MYLGIFRFAVIIAEFVLGFGLIFGCIGGLLQREGMYDSESTNIMLVSQFIGIGFGILLLAIACGFVYIPYFSGFNPNGG